MITTKVLRDLAMLINFRISMLLWCVTDIIFRFKIVSDNVQMNYTYT